MSKKQTAHRKRPTQTEKVLKEFAAEEEKACNATLLKRILKTLPSRWQNWILRALLTVILIGYFCFTIYQGPIAIMLTTLVIQVQCFREVIGIACDLNEVSSLPRFRSTTWYFLACANYFSYGETLADHFGVFFERVRLLDCMVRYHRFISFCLYLVGVVWFVLSLVRKYHLQQYSLLAWTHFALAIIVVQSYMIVRNIFQGLIWLVVPVSMVVCNDTMAYIFGSVFGRTPLIKLSPKKTWEGFIGGGISTVAYGLAISHFLCQQKYFVCPIEYAKNGGAIAMKADCEPGDLFQPKPYDFSVGFGGALRLDGVFTTYPFVLHSLALAFFSSVIGPFGGFFASGLKRACKIKDFGDILPGHGGIMDRFDCQYLMATFVNVYITSFIRTAGPERIFGKWSCLPPDQQLEFFRLLGESLSGRNLTGTV